MPPHADEQSLYPPFHPEERRYAPIVAGSENTARRSDLLPDCAPFSADIFPCTITSIISVKAGFFMAQTEI